MSKIKLHIVIGRNALEELASDCTKQRNFFLRLTCIEFMELSCNPHVKNLRVLFEQVVIKSLVHLNVLFLMLFGKCPSIEIRVFWVIERMRVAL